MKIFYKKFSYKFIYKEFLYNNSNENIIMGCWNI